jgi:hypothetical protein
VSVENNFTDYKKFGKINYDRLNNNGNRTKNNEKIQKIISFKPMLASYSEITNKLSSYFRQRMRVSEGHTREFRKRIKKVIENERITFLAKVELFFVGLRYAKHIPIMFLVIIDVILLIDQGIKNILTNDLFKLSIGIQGLSLIIYILYNILSLKINYKTIAGDFAFKDTIYLLLLNICTMPAFVMGSFLGLIKPKGNFYRTKRNE